MHFAFIPYGKRSEVELLLRDMEAQKHLWPMWKGEEKQAIYVQGAIRVLPFGIYEYVFPKEWRDLVLTTLIHHETEGEHCAGWIKKTFLRMLTKAEKIPEFKREKKFLWVRENVSIIPIGIKEDADMTEPAGHQYGGWTHEAL